jgi:hypothetical protein
MIFAYYEAGDLNSTAVDADFVKMGDVEAVREQLGRPHRRRHRRMTNYDRMV